MLKDITVLMSASSSPSMPGMIKCLRNNGERNIKVVGIDMTSDPSAKFMGGCFSIRYPGASDLSSATSCWRSARRRRWMCTSLMCLPR